MQSPTKNYSKKARKPNTFSQPAVQADVGEFRAGYFVMPDSTPDNTSKNCRNNNNINSKQERSPARRNSKHQTLSLESTAAASPNSNNKDRTTSNKFEQDNIKKPHPSAFVEYTKETNKKQELLPGTHSAPLKMYNYDVVPSKNPHSPTSSSKDCLSTSPTNSTGRWAGPAFGNAPPPSSLPLPEFPPMHDAPKHTAPVAISHAPVYTAQQFFSLSPSAHSEPLSLSPPHYTPYAAPFAAYAPQPVSHAHLAQLSTDLRRMLNISDHMSMHTPIMVVNSS